MLYRTYQSRSLARRIADSGEPDRLSRHRGVVQSINGDGTVNLTLDGSTLTLSSIPRLESAQIAVDDTIEAIIDENDVFIIGKLADSDRYDIVADTIVINDRIEYSTDPNTGGLKISDQDDLAHSWFPFTDGSFYFTSRPTLGTGQWVFRSFNADGTYDTKFTVRSNGRLDVLDGIDLTGTPVNVQFSDPTEVANFFLHFGNGNLFILYDADGDGNWAIPHPMKVTPNAVEFWDGGNEVHILDSGVINTSLGDVSNPAYGFRGATAGFYNNSGFLSACMSGERTLHFATNQIVGIGDNTKNLGNSSNRWSAVWAVDGTINTSDAEQKEDIVDSDLGLNFIRALRPRKNRRAGGTRPHYSLVAQEVKQTLDNMGIDFAGYIDPAVTFMEDEYTEGIFEVPGPLGLRYDEFVSPIIKAIQEIDDRVTALESPRP